MAIEYKKGYKYQLQAKTSVYTGIISCWTVKIPFATLQPWGELEILPGYAWDGASGCPDFKSVIRASLYHDCLYQMMRANALEHKWKKVADDLLEETAIKDGANKYVAKLIHLAVVLFGKPFTEREHEKKLLKAGK